MTVETTATNIQSDLAVLRALARRKLELAHDPLNLERKRLWHQHDAGRGERPLVLAESWVAFEDLPDSQLRCEEQWARDLERGLRLEIFQFEKIGDDHVIEPYATYNWQVQASDFGVTVEQEYAQHVSGNISSRRWHPPIRDINADFHLLRPRTFSVDRAATMARKARLEEVFDGIVPIRRRGGLWWTTGLTQTAIHLIGLENLMLYMCAEPEGLHRLMAFLQADCLAYLDFVEREGLLSLNNENDYIGSGSMGYTQALPQPDWREGDPVRLADVWVLSESQETVGAGPGQYEEFVFQYYKPIIERFGRVYYGCCEPVHVYWNQLKTLPNLKRLSISPWCDETFMAEALGRNYVYSRKPNPAHISVPDFDEDIIRKALRTTLTAARDCNVELIMKDVHTLCGQPWRMARWVEMAFETIEECA